MPIARRLITHGVAVLLVYWSAVEQPAYGETEYVVTDLGDFDPTFDLDVLNGAGQIVGVQSTGVYCDYYEGWWVLHAALWQDGAITDFGNLSGDPDLDSVAFGVNNLGQVVGVSELFCWSASGGSGTPHTFLWEDGVMTDLTPLGANFDTVAGINDTGQIIGRRDEFGYLFDNGEMIYLGDLGGDYVVPRAINNAGQIVGHAGTTARPNYGTAFIWQGGVMTPLGLFGGTASEATAINDHGQVVGYWWTGQSGGAHAFVWRDGVMMDLGTLGGAQVLARGINNRGQIVGSSWTGSGVSAFLWKDGQMIDLNDRLPPNSGWELSRAWAINEDGMIVGHGFTPTRQQQFLLTPTTDTDGDGLWDVDDPDNDNDGVIDGADSDPFDPMVCADTDDDGCDDCSVGTDGFGPLPDNDPANDGEDMDGDGVCAAGDDCPDDPWKSRPGVCGCGVGPMDGFNVETDSDGDAIPDGCDGCPSDVNKVAPGVCGCGVPDDDSDADAVLDCHDQCPGEDDRIDRNNNGIPDCVEGDVIPTISVWGVVVMALLLLGVARVCFGYHRVRAR